MPRTLLGEITPWTDKEQEEQSEVSDEEILLFAAWFLAVMGGQWEGLLQAQLASEAIGRPRFKWDEAQGEYLNYHNRVVRSPRIRNALDALVRATRLEMRAISADLIGGQTSLIKWRSQMSVLVKRLHVVEAVAARGGWNQMSGADWLDVGRKIKAQYEYLRGFAQDIAEGRQPMDGRLLRRADLYAQAGRSTYENSRRRFMQVYLGMNYERRRLGLADHCTSIPGLPGCPELAARGWQPIGTLPDIGVSPCIVNCKCWFEYLEELPEFKN